MRNKAFRTFPRFIGTLKLARLYNILGVFTVQYLIILNAASFAISYAIFQGLDLGNRIVTWECVRERVRILSYTLLRGSNRVPVDLCRI